MPILRVTDGEERILLSMHDLWRHERLLIDVKLSTYRLVLTATLGSRALAKTIDVKINDSARRLPAYRENKTLLTMKITTEGTHKQKISSRGIGSCKEYGTFSDRPPARCRPVVAGACRYSSSE